MSLTPNSILPHTTQEGLPPATSRPIRTPPRWNTEGFSRPVMPRYAQRDSYIASATGIWPSPVGRNSSFVTVTTTSPGPPVGKSSPHKTDYISYSPNSHLHSRPSSPTSPTQSQTPVRPRHPSISSIAGTQSTHHPLIRTSSQHQPCPGTTQIRTQTSRDDLSDNVEVKDDPRSIMTDEAVQVGQPSMVNMMDALKGRTEEPSSPGSRVMKDEVIRLAPPIWAMARPHHFASTDAGTLSPRTIDSDQALSPSQQSYDPFLSSTVPTYASRGRLDRSKVSFPTSRGMSESGDDEDEDDDVDERTRSSVSLNEAGGRGSISGSIGSPKQRLQEVEEEKIEQNRNITPTKQKEAFQATEENTTSSSGSDTVIIPPDSKSQLEQSKSYKTDYEQSSLPRILKPRLKINFAWDDMTIPSSITIVSTKGEEKHIEETDTVNSLSEGRPKTVETTASATRTRARTSSLNWATGLAIDTASGVAKYGLSYVPGPIRRRALRDRKWASETD